MRQPGQAKNKFKLDDLIISRRMFDKNKIVHYRVAMIKHRSLIVDVIKDDKKVFWTEVPFEILDDYDYLQTYMEEHPEYFL